MRAAHAAERNSAPDLSSSGRQHFLLCRLKKRRDFLAANKAAKIVKRGFILQCRHRNDDSVQIRVGFTASKKVGNAVLRNFAKRRLRELAACHIKENGIIGCDYVMIARKNTTVSMPYNILERDLASGLDALAAQHDP